MEEHQIKTKKKKNRFFETYIIKCLKNCSSENGITANAKQQLNSVLCSLAREFSDKAIQLTILSKKKTLSEKEVQNAIKSSITNILYSNFLEFRDTERTLIFPSSITEKFLRNFGLTKLMVTKTAPAFLASFLEFLTFSILENSIKLAKDHKRIRLTIREFELAVRTDKRIDTLFNSYKINFLGGGVVPQIHDKLLNKTKKKKKVVADIAEPRQGHRFRPGTVSLREIRKFQKASNCLTFAKLPFERFVRSILGGKSCDMKISKEAFIVLQYYIEQFVVNFLQDVNAVAIHSGRVKILPGDICFITKLRKREELDPKPFKKEVENKNGKGKEGKQELHENTK